jgi:hypothetical protein
MLTPQDDLIGHQTPTTFDHVANSDPAWMERLWYTGHPVPAGNLVFDIGLGYHPNRNVMDGFAGVAVDGVQYNFRVSRRARPNPLETTIGPLKIEVIEGLRRHRLTLAPNDSPLTFDMNFIATMNPHEEEQHFRRRQGRVTEHMARAEQLGHYEGWLKIGDKHYDIKPNEWLGQRDHSWGIRAEMRTDEAHPPVTFYPPFLYAWLTVQFPKRGMHIFFKERAPGKKIYVTGEEVFPIGERAKPEALLEDATHRFVFADDPRGQTVESAEFDLVFADGSKRTIQIKTFAAKYYLKGGLYGGLNGWFHGDDKGKFHSEHDRWDLSDPTTRKLVRTLADQVIEVRDGDDVGYGIIEYGVGKDFPMYQNAQLHPPI